MRHFFMQSTTRYRHYLRIRHRENLGCELRYTKSKADGSSLANLVARLFASQGQGDFRGDTQRRFLVKITNEQHYSIDTYYVYRIFTQLY